MTLDEVPVSWVQRPERLLFAFAVIEHPEGDGLSAAVGASLAMHESRAGEIAKGIEERD